MSGISEYDSETSYTHAAIAGDDYDPRPKQQRILLSAEGYSYNAIPAVDKQAQEEERRRIENDDKPVYPSPLQISIPGAGSALSFGSKLIFNMANSAVGRAVRKAVEARKSQEEAERQSRGNAKKLREAMDDHDRKMRDSGFRGREQNAIEHLEQKDRTGDDTMIA